MNGDLTAYGWEEAFTEMPGALWSTGAPSGWWDAITGTLSSVAGAAERAMQALEPTARALRPILQVGLPLVGGIATLGTMRRAGEAERAMRQAMEAQRAAVAPLREVAAPAVQAAQQLTPAGAAALMGGALPPHLEAEVEQWRQGAMAQLRDLYGRMGLGTSTTMAELEAWTRQQADLMRAQLARNLLASGLEATGAGQQALRGAAEVASAAAGQAGQYAGALQEAVAAAQKALWEYLAGIAR